MSKEDNKSRLESIIDSLNISSRLRNHSKLIKSCEEGMEIARNLKDYATQAYLMARKALFLSLDISLHIYAQQNIVLSPNWIGFSLKADERRYKDLTNQIKANRNEIKHLFGKAMQIAEQQGRQDLKAHILMLMGQYYGGKLSDYKTEHIAKKPRSRLSNLCLAKRYNLDYYLVFDRNDRRKMKKYLFLCRKKLLEAAVLFEAVADKSKESYALYNLANQLRTANKFKEASKYLTQAKIIARKSSDVNLLKMADEMEKRIKTRNKDIPNYVGGEE